MLVDWLKGMVFTIYAWNASPVDGTDVIRSYAAIGREFPFLVELNLEKTPAIPGENTAELVMEHIDSSFPLLRHQQELLQILIDDRRQHHRKLRDDKLKAKPPNFEVGDLVFVRVQVQSLAAKGTAKLQMKA